MASFGSFGRNAGPSGDDILKKTPDSNTPFFEKLFSDFTLVEVKAKDFSHIINEVKLGRQSCETLRQESADLFKTILECVSSGGRNPGKLKRAKVEHHQVTVKARAIFERCHSMLRTAVSEALAGARPLADPTQIRSLRKSVDEVPHEEAASSSARGSRPRSASPMKGARNFIAEYKTSDVLGKAKELAARTLQFDALEKIKEVEARVADYNRRVQHLLQDQSVVAQIDMNRFSREAGRAKQMATVEQMQQQALFDSIKILGDVERIAEDRMKRSSADVKWNKICLERTRLRAASSGPATMRTSARSNMSASLGSSIPNSSR